MIFVVPYLISKTLKTHRYGLYLTINRKRFGSLYLGVKTKEFNTIFCVFSSLALRTCFVIITFAMWTMPGILINLYMMLNNFNIIYIGWYEPFDTHS